MKNLGQNVATIGFFDGVHQGHRYLIRQVKDEAERRGMESLIVTFPTHPRKVLNADYQPCLLNTCDEKVALLTAEGVDRVVLMPFTEELAHRTAKEFMQILHDNYSVNVLVIGYDHRFGHNRSEGFDDYVRYGKEIGIDVVQAMEEPDGTYSSTVARNALLEGNVDVANGVLGYPYFLIGNVVSGFHVGTKIGYPTANVSVDPDKLIPQNGAYAVRVYILDENDGIITETEDRKTQNSDSLSSTYQSLLSCDSSFAYLPSSFYKGMLNIGHRPTLDNGPQLSIEVHILDYLGDLYGKSLRIEFIKRLRDERKFDTIQELQEQLAYDEKECRRLL